MRECREFRHFSRQVSSVFDAGIQSPLSSVFLCPSCTRTHTGHFHLLRPCFPAGWTVGRKFQCRQAEAKAGKNHAHHLHPTSHLSAPRDANQHLQSAVQRNLLVSLEGRSSQAPHLPITDPMPAPLPPPKIPPSKALAPAPVAVCSMLVRPRPPDSIAPSTSTFSPEGA